MPLAVAFVTIPHWLLHQHDLLLWNFKQPPWRKLKFDVLLLRPGQKAIFLLLIFYVFWWFFHRQAMTSLLCLSRSFSWLEGFLNAPPSASDVSLWAQIVTFSYPPFYGLPAVKVIISLKHIKCTVINDTVILSSSLGALIALLKSWAGLDNSSFHCKNLSLLLMWFD